MQQHNISQRSNVAPLKHGEKYSQSVCDVLILKCTRILHYNDLISTMLSFKIYHSFEFVKNTLSVYFKMRFINK